MHDHDQAVQRQCAMAIILMDSLRLLECSISLNEVANENLSQSVVITNLQFYPGIKGDVYCTVSLLADSSDRLMYILQQRSNCQYETQMVYRTSLQIKWSSIHCL